MEEVISHYGKSLCNKESPKLLILVTWHFTSFWCKYTEDNTTTLILFVRIYVLHKNLGPIF